MVKKNITTPIIISYEFTLSIRMCIPNINLSKIDLPKAMLIYNYTKLYKVQKQYYLIPANRSD